MFWYFTEEFSHLNNSVHWPSLEIHSRIQPQTSIFHSFLKTTGNLEAAVTEKAASVSAHSEWYLCTKGFFFTFCVVLDGSLNYSRLLNSCPDEALCQMLATDLCSSWIKYSIQDEKQQWYYTTPFTSAAHLKKQNDSSSLLQAWGFVAHTDPLIR